MLGGVARRLPVPPGDLHYERTPSKWGEVFYAWGRGVDKRDGKNAFFAVWLCETCAVGRRISFDMKSPTDEGVRQTIHEDITEHMEEFERRGIVDPSWWRGDARIGSKQVPR